MEGPDLVILKEKLQPFKHKKILHSHGYAKLNHKKISGNKIIDIKTWGKHLLVCFKNFTLKIHFGLFGIYRINDPKKGVNASLTLHFRNGNFDCYIAHPKLIEEDLNEVYDWQLDQLSPEYNAKKVKKLLLQQSKEKQIGDLLLDPDIFSGVGNIIRNESLYRARIHPESTPGAIPDRKLMSLISQTHDYSIAYLKASKKNAIGKTWTVYKQTECPLGHKVKKKLTGKTKRGSFICGKCMEKYV